MHDIVMRILKFLVKKGAHTYVYTHIHIHTRGKREVYKAKCYKSFEDCIWVTTFFFFCLPVFSQFSASILLLQ